MEAGTDGSSLESCARCTQPLPHDAPMCPHCSMPRARVQPFTISIGIVGLLALIFVLMIAITAIREADFATAPPAVTPQPHKASLQR